MITKLGSALVLATLVAGALCFGGCAVAADPAEEMEKSIQAAINELSPADRELALAQRWCAVETENRLGSMGAPAKVMLDDKPVFLCCAGCEKRANKDSKATLKSAADLRTINASLAKLSPADRKEAEAQKYCAVNNTSLLGSMGAPYKVMLDGKPAFLCCKGCEDDAKAKPQETIAKVAALKKANGGH
jgi:hypothetical protein